MKASAELRAFVEGWEGRRHNAYVCSAGHWTIGVGHRLTTYELGRHNRALTDAEIDELFTLDLRMFEVGVGSLLGPRITKQTHFDALVAFAFNVGLDVDTDEVPEGLGDSTLLRKHLRYDFDGAAAEFGKWVKARLPGSDVRVTVPGLVKRRAAEQAIYVAGDYSGRP